jgi:hypothetical protein
MPMLSTASTCTGRSSNRGRPQGGPARGVLRPDGSIIPGFYAGSGTAVGVSGSGHKGYSGGNGLFTATVLGRVAGEEVTDKSG